jgi:HAMP domain-containing protein
MKWLNISSWSINVKIFFLLLGAFLTFNLINVPFSIESFSSVNRQAFRQVVTESALRQKAAIQQDFDFALSVFGEFQSTLLQSLSVGFTSDTFSARDVTNNLIRSDFLDKAPTTYTQIWLINDEGQVISNLVNFGEARYTVEVDNRPDATDTPAYQAGLLLAENPDLNRNIDLVVEEVDGELSIQFIANVYDILDEFAGLIVVELNNDSIILNNIQNSGVNEDIYTFVASPNTSESVLIQDKAFLPQVNLNTQAVRSSSEIREAQFYRSGDHSVIGYYTPLFEEFRHDMLLIVELDEAVVLSDIIVTELETIGPNFLLSLFVLLIGILAVNGLFVRQITLITGAIRAISAGDLRHPIPTRTRGDEIGQLAESVVELREHLSTLTTDMDNQNGFARS